MLTKKKAKQEKIKEQDINSLMEELRMVRILLDELAFDKEMDRYISQECT